MSAFWTTGKDDERSTEVFKKCNSLIRTCISPPRIGNKGLGFVTVCIASTLTKWNFHKICADSFFFPF